MSREHGKKKPLKAPKKTKQEVDSDDEDLKRRLAEEKKKLEDARKIALKGGPIGTGKNKISK